MDGITVLKTYDAVVANTWGWSWPGFVVGLMILATLAVSIYYTIKEKKASNLIPGLVVSIFGTIISFLMFATGAKIKQPYYDVYIYGIINMDEFNEKYRVIKQDGLIYTITENMTE